jgi:hypothetical protein
MNASHPTADGAPPPVERRAVMRARGARAEATLSVSGIDRNCTLRDVSPYGVGLASPDLPQPGQRVWIETQELARSPAVVVWRDPARCGLRLEAEVATALAGSLDGKAPRPVRTQRFFVRTQADIDNGVEALRRDVIDISAEGLKLDGARGLKLGSRWLITLDGLRHALFGHVRWTSGGLAGFHFERPIPSDDLFALLCCRG